MNLRLDLAYNGAPFHGFARQSDVRTVQGDVERALGRLFGREPSSVCAGRTDTGVHALGQVMNVPEVPANTNFAGAMDALNGMLGPAISISRCEPAPDDFSARFSARSRFYVYAILDSPSPDPWLAPSSLWHRKPLDLDAMNEAAGHLIGHHDFSSFGRVAEGAPAERNLFELRCSRAGKLIKIRARANAFIQQMVRSLVGTLVYVGEGRMTPDAMPGILRGRDRSLAGPVAPPHGLCLVAVEYDDGWSGPGHSSEI
ncbi:MAG TPA: tRNA pseudouridine(38-40) synthase TruA [Actinomycetota bacterium]|nr:tRNA pseudouridine(38-40) synthase TruA [Actinomycetota bacterium]